MWDIVEGVIRDWVYFVSENVGISSNGGHKSTNTGDYCSRFITCCGGILDILKKFLSKNGILNGGMFFHNASWRWYAVPKEWLLVPDRILIILLISIFLLFWGFLFHLCSSWVFSFSSWGLLSGLYSYVPFTFSSSSSFSSYSIFSYTSYSSSSSSTS